MRLKPPAVSPYRPLQESVPRASMTDNRTPEQRRRTMQAVKSKNTGPEWTVRRLLHRMGHRYRLHRKDLPGSPDIVFFSRRKAIFVHGCFWHGHDCPKGHLPKSRLDYWKPKLERNKERDREKVANLEALGWTVLVIWQCEMDDLATLASRLLDFVGSADSGSEFQLPCTDTRPTGDGRLAAAL